MMSNFNDDDIFPIYKGLAKPLIFKMFKGKFIYQGFGLIAGSLIVGGALTAVNGLLGVAMMIILGAISYAYTISQQKKGLYTKVSYKGILIIKAKKQI